MVQSKRKSVVSLKAGRPPLSLSSTSRTGSGSAHKQSSKATRTLIRAHHNLHKKRVRATAEGNQTLVADLNAQIEQLGGLQAYQSASLTGQSKDRGGDSSALLVAWLEEAGLLGAASSKNPTKDLRVLEVGALSNQNAISARIGRGVECVRRIDLKSQDLDTIEEIDFMELPIPQSEVEKFDVVSLSLVLNYVPDAHGRGEMLERTRSFLRIQPHASEVVPCLFFVLPLPCISNSRYMTIDRLHELMASLGYYSIRLHQSAKLHYEMFYLKKSLHQGPAVKKLEVNPGKGRNNFSIILNTS